MLQKSSNFAMWFYGATLRMSNVGHLRNKKKLSFFFSTNWKYKWMGTGGSVESEEKNCKKLK